MPITAIYLPLLFVCAKPKVADNGKITSENGDMEKDSGNLFTGGFLCLGGERTCSLGVAQGVFVDTRAK